MPRRKVPSSIFEPSPKRRSPLPKPSTNKTPPGLTTLTSSSATSTRSWRYMCERACTHATASYFSDSNGKSVNSHSTKSTLFNEGRCTLSDSRASREKSEPTTSHFFAMSSVVLPSPHPASRTIISGLRCGSSGRMSPEPPYCNPCLEYSLSHASLELDTTDPPRTQMRYSAERMN